MWEILANASMKSRDRTQRGVCVFSAYAIASRTVATASKYNLLAFPHVDLDAVAPPILATDDLHIFAPESYNLY